MNPGSSRRRARRTYASHPTAVPQQEWTVVSSVAPPRPSVDHFSNVSGPSSSYQSRRPSIHSQGYILQQANEAPVQLHMPYPTQQQPSHILSPAQYVAGPSRALQPSPSLAAMHRYSPYPIQNPMSISSAPLAPQSSYPAAQSNFDEGQNIRLAPIRELADSRSERRSSVVKLPPISTLDGFRQGSCGDSAAVLKRLQTPDDQCLHPELSPHSRDIAHHQTRGPSPTYSYS